MKNTKKYLSTGVALAIALFAAVQISAMAPKVNPYLSPEQKTVIESNIKHLQDELNPKSNFFKQYFESQRALARAMIKGFEEVYYGNQPYTYQQIQDTVSEYHDRALAALK